MHGIGNNTETKPMIDTHCHLYDDSFTEDLDAVFDRATNAGVSCILLPNIDLASWEPLLEMKSKAKIPCYSMLGLHPCYVKEDYLDVLRAFKTVLDKEHENLIAIGEIGMDLYWDKGFFKAQEHALRIQIEWALEFNLPIALHVRDAFDPLLSILSDYTKTTLRGVFHCFTGTEEQAEHIMREHPAFYFGVGGVITYKNSGLSAVVKKLPLNRIVLETDAPYLPPTPYRGKRNEPSFLKPIAETLAAVLNLTESELISQTNKNATTLFLLDSNTL